MHSSKSRQNFSCYPNQKFQNTICGNLLVTSITQLHFCQVFMKLADNRDQHKISDEFNNCLFDY